MAGSIVEEHFRGETRALDNDIGAIAIKGVDECAYIPNERPGARIDAR